MTSAEQRAPKHLWGGVAFALQRRLIALGLGNGAVRECLMCTVKPEAKRETVCWRKLAFCVLESDEACCVQSTNEEVAERIVASCNSEFFGGCLSCFSKGAYC